MMRCQRLPLLSFVTLILLCASTAHSTDWYVDGTNEGGTEDGTSWATAWGTFADINWTTDVDAGDTIYISGGSSGQTYDGPLTVGDSGTSGNPITIRTGAGIDGHDGLVTISGGTNCINIANRQYITVNGEKSGAINLLCDSSTGIGIYATYPQGVKILYVEVDYAGDADNEHGIQFRDIQAAASNSGNEIAYCSVHDMYQDAISVLYSNSGTVYNTLSVHHNELYNLSDDGIQALCCMDIYNNTIRTMRSPNRGSGHPDAIQAGGGYFRIWNNTFKDVWGDNGGGMFIDPYYNSGLTVRNIYVYNNLIYGTTQQTGSPGYYTRGIIIGGDTPDPPDGLENVFVIGNTIVDMPSYCIDVSPGKIGVTGTMTNSYVVNNVCVNTQYTTPSSGSMMFFGSYVYEDTTGLTVDNNIVYAGDDGSTNISWNNSVHTYANFVADGHGQQTGYNAMPTFTTYTAYGGDSNDFSLSASDTVARDKGQDASVLSSLFAVDRLGVSRPQGSAWDIGAYEYGAGSDAPVLSSPVDSAVAGWPVVFTWEVYSGAVLYHIQADDDSEFGSPAIDDDEVNPDTACDESSCTYTVQYGGALSANTHYYWRVRALR